jgi:hypothetical protein
MKVVVDQRVTVRHQGGWVARLSVESPPPPGWHECRVVDVSLGGVAIDVVGPPPVLDAGVRVELQLDGAGGAGLQLRGSTRNVAATADGGSRVGIEWSELGVLERELLSLLLQRRPVAS